jgi:ATP-dependent DNA helicase UvrD/PcrA
MQKAVATPGLQPTDEQLHIIDLVRNTEDNLVINALAGTGKTSTLEMVQNASKTQPILYLAFNKRIAEEAEKKFLSTTTVRTLNSLGHRIWAKTLSGKITLDPRKSQTLLRQIISDLPKIDQPPLWSCFWQVMEGVQLAKALGYVPDGKYPDARRLTTRGGLHDALDEKPDEVTADLIDAVLTLSIKTAYEGFIDYNDQLYMPALFGGTYPRYPLVLCDEKQDFNPVNYEMLRRLVRARVISVGDRFQSIYGFRGAKPNAMSQFALEYNATSADLSVSFRCPQAIVEHARWRAPHFKWLNPGGKVERLESLTPEQIPDSSAIICRNNAPLFKLALLLLSSGRSVRVAGSDVGPKVVGTMRRLGPDGMPRSSVLSAIADWRAEKLGKGSRSANDIADAMKVFAHQGENLGQAVAVAEHVMKQTGTLTLTTGHKAKGLEWPVVFHLDPWLCRDDEQDQNLRYVITTRSKGELYEIDSRHIHA